MAVIEPYRLTQTGAEVQQDLNDIEALAPATTESAGLMSAADKTKLDGVESGAKDNIFIAEYGVTTLAEILAAVAAGKMALAKSGSLYFAFSDIGDDYAIFFRIADDGEIYVVSLNGQGWNEFSFYPEDTANRATSLSAQSTDAQYPSAKCVYDALAGIDTKRVLTINSIPESRTYTPSEFASAVCAWDDFLASINCGYAFVRVGTTGTSYFYPVISQSTNIVNTAYIAFLTEDGVNTIQAFKTGSSPRSDITVTATYVAFPTSAQMEGWTGKYTKPSGGIPKTDLASAVQTSLENADRAAIVNYEILNTQSGGGIKAIVGNIDGFQYAIGPGNADGSEDKVLATTEQIQFVPGSGTGSAVLKDANLEANNPNEVAVGRNNFSATGLADALKTIFSVGVGSSANNKDNAIVVKRDGKVYLKGAGYIVMGEEDEHEEIQYSEHIIADLAKLVSQGGLGYTQTIEDCDFIYDDGQGHDVACGPEIGMFTEEFSDNILIPHLIKAQTLPIRLYSSQNSYQDFAIGGNQVLFAIYNAHTQYWSDFLVIGNPEQNITGKADKVTGATSGNFAGLDSNGNLVDSGKKASDFLTQHQDISGKMDKPVATTSNQLLSFVPESGHIYSIIRFSEGYPEIVFLRCNDNATACDAYAVGNSVITELRFSLSDEAVYISCDVDAAMSSDVSVTDLTNGTQVALREEAGTPATLTTITISQFQPLIDSSHKLDYGLLSNTPTIPTVPTISTNVQNDKASDVKTSSPKSVYDEVHPAVVSSQPQGGFAPNVVYDLGELTGTVTFALASPTDNSIPNPYHWTFDTGSTAPTVTWPSGIVWPDGVTPTIDANKHYEVLVRNGYASILVFTIPSA